MNSLTLTYGDTEKFLADWGYSNPVLKLVSQAVSTFTVDCPGGDPAGAEDIPYGGAVLIRLNRTYAGGSFSGGTIVFAGRRTAFPRTAHPDNSRTSRLFSDPWWDLENTLFQHYWKTWNGTAFVNFYFSRLNLFQDISAGPSNPWTYLTTLGQIQEIITYAATICGCNLQAGTIDPTWNVPAYAVKAITCAEALRKCLQPMADVVTWFDYSFTPPKLHIRQRANVASLTLPYAGSDAHGRHHESSELRDRPDLRPTCVSVQYMQNNIEDERAYTQFSTDTYPIGAAPQALGSLVVPIDLRGSVRVNVKGQVTSVPCDPTTTAFWKRHSQEFGAANIDSLALLNPAINDGSLYCLTIRDRGGNLVSLADYPYEQLGGGDVASWMKAGSTPITAREVIITGWLKYQQKDLNPDATIPVLHTITHHQVVVKTKLTNSAPAGTDGSGNPLPTRYSALQSYTPGDPNISGLAQNLHTSLATLQWEGSHSLIESNVFAILGPGNNLNLSGGAAAWETMNAAIYQTTIQFAQGRTLIEFGPHPHLTAGQLFEYLLMWRQREVYDNPGVRSSGQSTAANDVTMPEHQHVDDVTHQKPNASQYTWGAPQTDTSHLPDAQINLDAAVIANHAGLMGSLAPAERVVKLVKQQICVNGNKFYVVLPAGPFMTS